VRNVRLTESNRVMKATGVKSGMPDLTSKEGVNKMIRTRDDLLDDYRNADPTRRLHLYLEHRELRSEFMETEQNELRAKTVCKRAGSGWLSRFFACPFEGTGWHIAGARGCCNGGNPSA